MNKVQSQINIAVTDYLKDVFSGNQEKYTWSLNVVNPVIVEEEQYEGKMKIMLNSVSSIKVPFYITEQQSIDLGGPVSKLAPENDYLFNCTGDVTVNESIELLVEFDPNTNKFSIEEGENTLVNNSGSDFFVLPTAFESGSMPYREPLMRFHVVEKDVQKSVARELSNKLKIESQTFSMPENELFINPQDEKIINDAIGNIEEGINYSNQITIIIRQLIEQTIAKKENEEGLPTIEQVFNKLGMCVQAINSTCSRDVLLRYVSKIRSPQIKQALGLSANSYFNTINEHIIQFEGYVVNYQYLTSAKLDELQSKHQENCQDMGNMINRIKTSLIDLQNAYEAYL